MKAIRFKDNYNNLVEVSVSDKTGRITVKTFLADNYSTPSSTHYFDYAADLDPNSKYRELLRGFTRVVE